MNKDDTLLIDRIKFLEAANARLSAQNKQRKPIFGKLDISQEAKSVAFVFVILLLAVGGTSVGIASLWPEPVTTFKCNQEKIETFLLG